MLKGSFILVCPLNWGLGHVTRCIPIIKELEHLGANVVLCSSGESLNLLKELCPSNKIFELPDYQVRYHSWGRLDFKMILSLPRILSAIKKEKLELDRIINKVKPSLIISDNRYGIWSSKAPSVFISHQLNLRSSFLKKIINKFHLNLIENFDEVWVPDFSCANNLSGELGRLPENIGKKVFYIGPMSNLKSPSNIDDLAVTTKWDYLVVLSGPEPQREILERKIINIFYGKKEKVLIVQGVVGKSKIRTQKLNISIINFLVKDDLCFELLNSKNVICRSGYSSIMDLFSLGKRAILVPTPGQTEQEYLATYHRNHGRFITIEQRNLSYKSIISENIKPEKVSHIKANDFEVIRRRLIALMNLKLSILT